MIRSLMLTVTAVAVTACAVSESDVDETIPQTAPPVTEEAPTTTPPVTHDTTVTTAAVATTSTSTSTTLADLQRLEYREVVDIAFPITVTARPGDDVSLLAQRSGVVHTLAESGVGDVVIDLSSRTTTDGERGLLGLARHPDEDSRLFIHYTDTAGDTVVAEFTFDGRVADPDSERVLLEVSQPASNHNGGMIQFGPDDALYVGLGDGGASGDRFGHGQNPDTLLGGLVRIDVDSGESELWHMGLRNPWRFWIDGEEVWIADVGQNAFEEVDLSDITVPGINYGWPITEGAHCYRTDPCDTEGITLPVIEIAHGDGGTCSITGGVVYRGPAIPELHGRFLFSDYCGGYLRSVDREAAVMDHTPDVGALGAVVSFGVDGAGEVYVLTTDRVVRLDAVR